VRNGRGDAGRLKRLIEGESRVPVAVGEAREQLMSIPGPESAPVIGSRAALFRLL